MVCNGFNCYFTFWAIFYTFTYLTAKKLKTKKMEKNPGDIIILQQYTINHDHICYTVPEIWCVTDVTIFHFGPFFALLPNSPKNQN